MGRTLLTIIVIACALPVATQAQESPAEQEVWDALQACIANFVQEDLDAGLACIHDDFDGWRLGEPVPRGKDEARRMTPYFLETRDVKAYNLRPLSVKVHGDFAIIHYYGFWIQVRTDGQEEITTERWTDIMIKENGKWMWISDHGGVISGN